MTKIFILNGGAGVGKDTFVALCSKFADCAHYSSVAKVKEYAKLMGWDGKKDEKDRKFLSDLKDILTDYNDTPFNDIKAFIQKEVASGTPFVFIDIREPDEIERARQEFNAKTILIVNNRVPVVDSNHADASVYDYVYDFVISNNGTIEDLSNSAEAFINSEIISINNKLFEEVNGFEIDESGQLYFSTVVYSDRTEIVNETEE